MAEVDLYNLKKVGRVYHCDFILMGTRIHRSTRKTMIADAKIEAKRWYDEVLDKANGVVPLVTVPTLAECLEEWTQAQRGAASDRHIQNVRDAHLLHLPELLPLRIDMIGNREVEVARTAYLNSRGTGHRPGQNGEWDLSHTVGGANKIIQHLGSVMGWAVSRKIITHRPYDLKPLKVQEDPKSVVWPEQVVQFLATADGGRKLKHHAFPHSATAMRLMIGLGLREAEALGARWEWVDRRRQVYMVGQTKNRKVREIPIPSWLLDHLDRVLGPTTALPRGWILTDPNGRPHSGQFTLKPIARCAALLGVNGLTPHSLRRAFATAHNEAGTDLDQIQEMMGHEDRETTLGYIVRRSKRKAEAQDRVAELMGLAEVTRIPPSSGHN